MSYGDDNIANIKTYLNNIYELQKLLPYVGFQFISKSQNDTVLIFLHFACIEWSHSTRKYSNNAIFRKYVIGNNTWKLARVNCIDERMRRVYSERCYCFHYFLSQNTPQKQNTNENRESSEQIQLRRCIYVYLSLCAYCAW